jgi:CO/xanthine dehydrogenase Mo-binding subunit
VAGVDAERSQYEDGIRNQIEGGIIQAMSWTLFESVDFDEEGIHNVDWASYPILRFSAVPDSVARKLSTRTVCWRHFALV